MKTRRGVAAWLRALAVGVAFLAVTGQIVDARQIGGSLPEVALPSLPVEAQQTYSLIRRGGPFPHERDGVVFGNREKILPLQPRGYYHEYTVPTPGAKNRGARRIVCGGAKRAPEACYYTDDHYQSFRRIADAR